MVASTRLWIVVCVLLAACAAPEGGPGPITVSSPLSSETLPATLMKPPGDGPFPAVVIMHDCSGLGPKSSGSPGRWAGKLVAQGYVVMIPDSFTPRGFPGGVCTVPGPAQKSVNALVRAADAYGALAALRRLPFVDGAHVGIMGGSHGGSTTLAAMVEPPGPQNPLAAAKRYGFAAAIALYPGCAASYGTWSVARRRGEAGLTFEPAGIYKPVAPLLVLIGEKDDWTPAEPCRQLVDRARAAGYPVDIKIYPGAEHSFDSNAPRRYRADRNNANAPDGRGATTGGDPAAWADAEQRVAEFFAAHLMGRR